MKTSVDLLLFLQAKPCYYDFSSTTILREESIMTEETSRTTVPPHILS